MTQYIVRRATLADAAALSELIQRTIRVSNGKDYDRDTIERICSYFSPGQVTERIANERIFVCFDGSQLVGTAGLRQDHLRSMFVEPGFQRQGIGKLLADHIERTARQNAITVIQVESSITARRFYESLGYRFVAFKQHDEGSTYFMRKTLS